MSEQILLKLPVRVGVKRIYDMEGDCTLYYVAMVEGCHEMAAVGSTKEKAVDMLKTLVDNRMTAMSPALNNEIKEAVNANMEFLLDVCGKESVDSTSILTNIKIDPRFLTLTDTEVRTVARNICLGERRRLGDTSECNPDDFLLDRRLGCIVVTLPGDVVMYGNTIKLWFYGSSVDDPARVVSYDFDELLGGEGPEYNPWSLQQSIPDDPDKMLDSLMDMLTAAIRQTAVSGKDYYRKSLYQALDNLVAAKEVAETNRGYGPPPDRSIPAPPSDHDCPKENEVRDENEFSAETPKDPVQ